MKVKKPLEDIVPKKNAPKTQKEKFEQMERKNPNLRTFVELFDLVIKL